MRARVNHLTGFKLHLLHLNCYSKCSFSIFILFLFGFAPHSLRYVFSASHRYAISTVCEMKHSVFPTMTV